MRYVYGIAFRGPEFVMVFNPRRDGWEMPGGKVEEGESDLEAMSREFREEVGREFIPVASRADADGVTVYAGELGGPSPPGEMEWRVFRELPEQLSFPMCEYLPLIAWARGVMGRENACDAGDAPACRAGSNKAHDLDRGTNCFINTFGQPSERR